MPVTNYIWDEVNDTLLMEKDEAGNTTAAYTYEPGPYGPLISQRRSGQTSYHHFDGQGSTRQLTDAGDAVTDTCAYTAFGETVAQSGTTTNPFGYKGALGYYANPETDTIHVRRRTYDRNLSRWIRVDDMWPLDAMNPYLHARNNPINMEDPSGFLSQSTLPPLLGFIPQRLIGPCGAFYWTTRWQLDPGENDGFIIQRVCGWSVVRNCDEAKPCVRVSTACPNGTSASSCLPVGGFGGDVYRARLRLSPRISRSDCWIGLRTWRSESRMV